MTVLLTEGSLTGDCPAALQPPLGVARQLGQEREASLSGQASPQVKLTEVGGLLVVNILVVASLVAGVSQYHPVSHCNQSGIIQSFSLSTYLVAGTNIIPLGAKVTS